MRKIIALAGLLFSVLLSGCQLSPAHTAAHSYSTVINVKLSDWQPATNTAGQKGFAVDRRYRPKSGGAASAGGHGPQSKDCNLLIASWAFVSRDPAPDQPGGIYRNNHRTTAAKRGNCAWEAGSAQIFHTQYESPDLGANAVVMFRHGASTDPWLESILFQLQLRARVKQAQMPPAVLKEIAAVPEGGFVDPLPPVSIRHRSSGRPAAGNDDGFAERLQIFLLADRMHRSQLRQ
jgi:hypothetical protein